MLWKILVSTTKRNLESKREYKWQPWIYTKCTVYTVFNYNLYLLTTSHTVTLYNCSMGREDCSLCKNADPKYRCVWCVKQKACVYEKLCSTQGSENPYDIECPDPQITGVSIYIVINSLRWHLNWEQYVFPILVISGEKTLTGDWIMYRRNGFLLFLLIDELKVCFCFLHWGCVDLTCSSTSRLQTGSILSLLSWYLICHWQKSISNCVNVGVTQVITMLCCSLIFDIWTPHTYFFKVKKKYLQPQSVKSSLFQRADPLFVSLWVTIQLLSSVNYTKRT